MRCVCVVAAWAALWCGPVSFALAGDATPAQPGDGVEKSLQHSQQPGEKPQLRQSGNSSAAAWICPWGGPGMGFGRRAGWGGQGAAAGPGAGRGWGGGFGPGAGRGWGGGQGAGGGRGFGPGAGMGLAPGGPAFVDANHNGICDHYELRRPARQ